MSNKKITISNEKEDVLVIDLFDEDITDTLLEFAQFVSDNIEDVNKYLKGIDPSDVFWIDTEKEKEDYVNRSIEVARQGLPYRLLSKFMFRHNNIDKI